MPSFVQQLQAGEKKTAKLRIFIALCDENPLLSGALPSERASNAESVTITVRKQLLSITLLSTQDGERHSR